MNLHSSFKRKALIVIACLFVFALSKAADEDAFDWIKDLKVPNVQDIEIMKWNEEVLLYSSTVSRSDMLYGGIINMDRNRIYLYNRKNKTTIEKNIKLKDGEHFRNVENILYFDNNIHVISSFVNEEQKKIYLFDETVNSATLELNNDVKVIHTTDYSTVPGLKISSLETKVTMSKRKIITRQQLKFKNGFKHFINIYNTTDKSSTQFCREIENDKVLLSDCLVDLNDNLYTIEKPVLKKGVDDIYTICYFKKGQQTPVTHTIKIENKHLRASWAINSKNQLIASGFIFRSEKDGITGCFSALFDANFQNDAKINAVDFTSDYLQMGLTEKESKKLMKSISNNDDYFDDCRYISDSLHIDKNDEISLMGQRFKVERKTVGDADKYLVGFYDIFVIQWNADGSLKWNKKIARSESFVDDNYFSGDYFRFYGNDQNLNVMYYKTKEGESKAPEYLLSTFDKDGNETTKTVIQNKKTVASMFTRYCKYIGNNKIVLTGIKHGFVATSSTYNVAEYQIDNKQ